jgi:hypothetical protein
MLNDRSFPIPHRINGHPRGIYTDELVSVPWLEHVNSDRRQIEVGQEAAARSEIEESEQEIIDERLNDLGYRS